MKSIYYYETQMGKLGIVADESAVSQILFEGFEPPNEIESCETEIHAKTADQLNEYFSGRRKEFSIPLAPAGTAFQRAVWLELQKIPYGETRTYRQIAEAVGRPKACRAVGAANHNNPIPFLIPCHRVIGTGGGLTGYAGGIDMKQRLLLLEQTNQKNDVKGI